MSSKSSKKYVFGYGSLVSRKDLQRTLKHEVSLMQPAVLKGWVRDWSIVIKNAKGVGHYRLVADESLPEYVVVLNVRKPKDGERPTNPNGILFEVTDEDLKFLDKRESHYVRTEVTKDIDIDVDGKVYTYVGLAKHMTLNKYNEQAILAHSYVDIVNSGFDSTGDNNAETFRTTTLASQLESKPTFYR